MTVGRWMACWVLVVMLVAAPLPVLAQDGGQADLAQGVTLDWDSPWAERDDLRVATDQVEIAALARDGAIMVAGNTVGPVPGEQLRDEVLATYLGDGDVVTIDRGEYDNVAYSLDRVSTPAGATVATFALVIGTATTTRITMLISDVVGFGEALRDAQAGISIDGEPVFDGIDGAALQEQVDAASFGTSATPAAATGGAATIGANAVPVSWTGAWRLNEGASEDGRLELTAVGDVPARVVVRELDPQQGDPDATAVAERFAAAASAGDRVVAAVNAEPGRLVFVLAEDTPDGTVLIVYDLTLDEAGSVAIVLAAAEGDAATALTLANAGITVAGGPAFARFDELLPGALNADPAG